MQSDQSIYALCVVKDSKLLHEHNEDSDQSARMHGSAIANVLSCVAIVPRLFFDASDRLQF